MKFIEWKLEKAKTNRSKGYYKSNGYTYGRAPYHPYANNKGYVKLSRLLMENHLGRFLTRNEHANAKLLFVEAEEIKSKYKSGNYTYEQLGREYNIDLSYVGKIVREEYRFSKGLVE